MLIDTVRKVCCVSLHAEDGTCIDIDGVDKHVKQSDQNITLLSSKNSRQASVAALGSYCSSQAQRPKNQQFLRFRQNAADR